MVYAMSDIHGCYRKYMDMLSEISFSSDDTLYVIGDVLDRGPEPMKVLHDMSIRANVLPLLGNHEHIAYSVLSRLLFELTDENIKTHFGADLMDFYERLGYWTAIGGETTLLEFAKLPIAEREYMLEYLSEFSLYETVKAGGKRYILTHAGLPEGAALENLDSFDAYDFVMAETDYDRQYFDDVYLVTGHIPTLAIDKQYNGRILRKNNNIAIDGGAVFGGMLACICLDTGEEFYV